jgi:hypothetical protein
VTLRDSDPNLVGQVLALFIVALASDLKRLLGTIHIPC